MTEYLHLTKAEEEKIHKHLNLVILLLSCCFVYTLSTKIPILRSNLIKTIQENRTPNVPKLIERNIPAIKMMIQSGKRL